MSRNGSGAPRDGLVQAPRSDASAVTHAELDAVMAKLDDVAASIAALLTDEGLGGARWMALGDAAHSVQRVRVAVNEARSERGSREPARAHTHDRSQRTAGP